MINFQRPYNRTDFVGFLADFLPDDFTNNESEISIDPQTDFTPKFATKTVSLGTCKSLELDVYEITHSSSGDARVGIAQDAFKLMLHKSYNNRALVIFQQEGSKQYRFSLLQIEAEQNEHSSRIRYNYSNPRRYSFLLGEDAHVKTPKQFLLEKGKINSKDGDLFKDLQERFSVEVLTKQFYRELSNWYFWAIKQVHFPSQPTLPEALEKGKELDDLIKQHNATNVIRLLTRILFVWFIKQKGLIPDELFDIDKLQKNILKEINPIHTYGLFTQANKESIYYKAILQNLFFATLNCPINPQSDDEDKRQRGFRRDKNYGDDFGNDWLYRYKKYFKNSDAFLDLMNSKVPFLNGGLFECLDDKQNKKYIDCFSDSPASGEYIIVPDYLFFGIEEHVDLSDDYGENLPLYKKAAVTGLINILKTYNFTVEENTPAEIEVALDPELLGKVFENLLASYNPETKSTARKQTGSFYTPREIVTYMVDESLLAYFEEKTSIEENKLRPLFEYADNTIDLTNSEKESVINALYECKVLDPACGSGAFPMGVLQKMVHILKQIDENNTQWEKVQKANAQYEIANALDIEDKKERENKLLEINSSFDVTKNSPDYARKLYLIENCIYGVDIQPIAIQISKLRFFISLVVDQINSTDKENFGIVPLPNLETKFVAADTLIGIDRPDQQLSIFNTPEIDRLQKELQSLRHKLFGAKTKKTKLKYRLQDKEKRIEIAKELKNNGWDNDNANKLANWDPYNQNESSPFFDPEWMFGLAKENVQLNSSETGYFDVVIGNPPYIDSETMTNNDMVELRRYIVNKYTYIIGNWDIYMAFFEKGLNLSKSILTYITPDKWLSKPFGIKFREKCMMPKMNKILHVGSEIFENVRVDGIISMFSNKSKALETLKFNEKKRINRIAITSKDKIKEPYLIDYLFSENANLITKIEQNTQTLLTDFGICENACATNDAYNLVPLIENNNSYDKKENLILINTGTIGKYVNKWGQKEITYLGNKILYPIVNRNKFTDSFGKSYVRKALSPKLIFKGLNLLDVCFDFDGKILPGKSTLVICNTNPDILKYLGAILNSKLSIFYIKTKYSSSSYCGGITFSKLMLNNLPIPNFNPLLVIIVDKILNAKKENPDAITKQLENEIDQLVYKLYGLTDDEISIIENS